jgi:hypothetical protein
MKRITITLAALIIAAGPVLAGQADSTASYSPPPAKEPSRIYWGGTIGFNFGDYTRYSVAPLIGYRLTDKVSLGVKGVYEYIKDSRYAEEVTGHNYGGSLFGRYRPHRQFYLHAEGAYMSYEWQTAEFQSEREWVPFLLLGGGFVQPISPKASAYIEVLVDVLQDSNSPYEDWEPWISVGVAAGF